MYSFISPLFLKKSDWYRGRTSDSGTRGPGFSSWFFLFSFFCILERKFEVIAPNNVENYLEIDEINSKVCIKSFNFG